MLTLPEQSATAQRVEELRTRRDRLEQELAELHPRYDRALRDRRGAGLDELGAQVMRLSCASDALAREIRRLET